MALKEKKHVVVIGGGFGGLYVCKGLIGSNYKITLVDKRNFHLFQPLLYQVAAGELSPGDIAAPLRSVFHRHKQVDVLMDEVIDCDPEKKEIVLKNSRITYDFLVVATGALPHYFGNEKWPLFAPGLKTVEDAVAIRHKILHAFERAEGEPDPVKRQQQLTFAIIGGGPTGVELAGAIGELTRTTLKDDFRHIIPVDAAILLIEAGERILSTFTPDISKTAVKALKHLGVTVMEKTSVKEISSGGVLIQINGEQTEIACQNIFWTAGVKASPFGQILANRFKVEIDRSGRIPVQADLRLNNHPDVFVIGDQSFVLEENGKPLPGLATVAMQQGRFVARLLTRISKNKKTSDKFRYVNKGTLAVIGKNKAVAELGKIRVNGRIAWFLWTLIHIWYLIGFDNKVLVLLHWAWNYLTDRRNARLITGEDQVV